MSGHFWYSQLGFVDHHAAVAWVTTALLGAAMAVASVWERGIRGPSRLRALSALGLGLGGSLLLWPGCLLHVALVEVALAVQVLAQRDVSAARAGARDLAAVQGLALLLVLPASAWQEWPQWGPYSPVVLSRFQPWLFASLGVLAAAWAGVWRWSLPGGSRVRRWGSAGLAGVCVLGASVLSFPGLAPGAGEAWGWLSRSEAFQAQVGESAPLLVEDGGFALGAALARLSGFVLLFPLTWLLAVRWALGQRPRAALLVWLAWSAGLFVATLLQRRFFNSFSVALCLLMAWACCGLWRAAGGALVASPARALAARGLLGVALLGLLWPLADGYRHHVENLLAGPEGPQRLPRWAIQRRELVETARWMERRTPPTRGWLDASLEPEYGVVAPWTLGHVLVYVARRPSVVGNFGDDLGGENFARVERYFRGDEIEGSRILDALGARYVVAHPMPELREAARDPASLLAALYLRDGSAPEQLTGGAPPALERHRLVFESRPPLEADVASPSAYKVFEHVRGARVEGRAPPGSRLLLGLSVRTNRGRAFDYRARAVADRQGRYAFRLPYANQGLRGAVRVAPHYTLRCRSDVARLVVRERDVRSGAELSGPELCSGPDGGGRPSRRGVR
jgi:asparagine N-glycosylation enzyme membrane subunit Stt3